MSYKVFATVLGLLLSAWIIGAVFLGIANTYSSSYVGILKKGEVSTETTCSSNCKNNKCSTSCSNQYYVDEIFYKGVNTTSTCTVRRLTSYYFKGDANNFVSRMKLGTKRTLYESPYSHGTCMDDKIREYYNIVGGIVIGFPTFVACCLLILFLGITFHDLCLFCCWCNSSENKTNKERQSYFRYMTYNNNIEIPKITENSDCSIV